MVRLNEVVKTGDILSKSSRQMTFLLPRKHDQMFGAVVCNMGHSNTEIDVVSSPINHPLVRLISFDGRQV